MSTFPSHFPGWSGSLSIAALIAGLTACGGGGFQPPDAQALLVADDGSSLPSAPQSVPADPSHHTRAMRFATAAQARHLEVALGSRLVRINTVCCDTGVLARGVAGDALLIDVDEPARAAAIADLLDGAGAGRVWVVVR